MVTRLEDIEIEPAPESILYRKLRKYFITTQHSYHFTVHITNIKALSDFLSGRTVAAGRGLYSTTNAARQRVLWQLFPCQNQDLIAKTDYLIALFRVVNEQEAEVRIWIKPRTPRKTITASGRHLFNFFIQRVPGVQGQWTGSAELLNG